MLFSLRGEIMLAIGYGRVSTAEQGQEERFSLTHQKEHISAECAVRGWHLAAYFEDMESGKSSKKRTGFNTAMSAMAHADVLIVHEMDRLSRNLIDTLLIADQLHKLGKKFVSIHDSIDSSSEQGELQMHILAVFAHYFRKQLGKKVHGGMSTKAKAGGWNSKPPYGYSLVDKQLVVNEDESWIVVKKIYEMYLANHGMRAIAVELNNLGLRTRNGSFWQQLPLGRILQGRVYCGDTVWNMRNFQGDKQQMRPQEEWIIRENTHPAIIDRETFVLVQERIKTKRRLPGRTQNTTYLLSGIIKCGHCGGSMIGRTTKNLQGTLYYHYICSAYHKMGQCECISIRCRDVEADLKEYISSITGPATEAARFKCIEMQDAVVKRKEIESLKKLLATYPAKKDKQLQLLEAGRISDTEFDTARSRLNDEEAALVSKIESLESQLANVDEPDMLKVYLADWPEYLSSPDTARQKTWLQDKVKAVVYHKETGIQVLFNAPLVVRWGNR